MFKPFMKNRFLLLPSVKFTIVNLKTLTGKLGERSFIVSKALFIFVGYEWLNISASIIFKPFMKIGFYYCLESYFTIGIT